MVGKSYFLSRGLLNLAIKTTFSFVNLIIAIEVCIAVKQHGLIGILGMIDWVLVMLVLGTAAAWFHVRQVELDKAHQLMGSPLGHAKNTRNARK